MGQPDLSLELSAIIWWILSRDSLCRMKRSRKLTVAGVLDLVAGMGLALASVGGCMNVINAGRTQDAWMLALVAPGIVAMIAGIRILDRKKGWALALAGSICAILAGLGLVSTGIVVTSKREFLG